MSAVRGYAEVIADLNGCANVDDEAGFHLNATVQREAAVLLAGVAAALPNCPTCGGTGTIPDRYSWELPHLPCPADCDHGKVTVARLAATWQAVYAEDLDDDDQTESWVAAFRYLRSVRPPSPKEGT